MVQETGRVVAGETVLVTAAAGGTGHFAVQIAQSRGCRVVATCGGPEKVRALQALGAHRIVDHRSEVPLSPCELRRQNCKNEDKRCPEEGMPCS